MRRHAALEWLQQGAWVAVAAQPWQAALLQRAALPLAARTCARSLALAPADEE